MGVDVGWYGNGVRHVIRAGVGPKRFGCQCTMGVVPWLLLPWIVMNDVAFLQRLDSAPLSPAS